MKSSFTDCLDRPLLASMIQEETPPLCVARIRNSIYDGADVIAVHIEAMQPQYATLENLKGIYAYAGSRPVYSMDYRHGDVPDEELVRVQMLSAQAGASMVDVMGDIYDPAPLQLTRNPRAIERQIKMIDQFHDLGCQVMLSSHTWAYMTAEETLEHCDQLIRRGADMVKIAMCAFREDQMDEVYRTTRMMKKELKVPFLHVCMGQYGKLHRSIAPLMGSCMALCVQEYNPVSNKEQPVLRCARAVLDNLDRDIARDDQLGCVFRTSVQKADN